MRSPVLPCLCDPSLDAISQNVAFELREDGKHAGQGAPTGRGQVERLRERDEADPQLIEFLQGADEVEQRPPPTIEPPDHNDIENDIELAAAGRFEHRLALWPHVGAGADVAHLHADAPAVLPASPSGYLRFRVAKLRIFATVTKPESARTRRRCK